MIQSQSSTEGTFHCPFSTCPHAQGPKKGWQIKVSVIMHVANYHLAERAVPSKSWFKLMSQWVCGHCLTLHSAKRSRSNDQPAGFVLNLVSAPVGDCQCALWVGHEGRKGFP